MLKKQCLGCQKIAADRRRQRQEERRE